MGQHIQFPFQFLFFARLQTGIFQLGETETKVIAFLLRLRCPFFQFLQFRHPFPVVTVQCPVFLQQSVVPAKNVQNIRLKFRLAQ